MRSASFNHLLVPHGLYRCSTWIKVQSGKTSPSHEYDHLTGNLFMTNKFRVTVGIIMLSSLLFSSSAPLVVSVRVTMTENKRVERSHIPSDQVFPRPQPVTLQLQKAHPSPTPVPTSTSASRGLVPSPPITTWKAQVMAWIYPGPPGCHAAQEYTDGRRSEEHI